MSRPAGILLDIEGTTSSITFVHDVMFPFVLDRLDQFLEEHLNDEVLQPVFEQIAHDCGQESFAAWKLNHPESSERNLIADEVRRLMASDVKATGLKVLQGFVWKAGFESGQLQAHVYEDVIPSVKYWKENGIDVRIYSSGSIAAQKLFFGHLDQYGNQLNLFSGHYDTTYGGKKESASYTAIAADWGLEPSQITFISDIADELVAAKEAGVVAIASLRPGNAELPAGFPIEGITSFSELQI